MTHQLHHGDCLEVLRSMPDCSVDSIVTDPPYGLSFMGKKWDYDVPSVDVWVECLRVLKPGGHLLAFAGTRTQHRMAVRIEDAGFEIRDMIAWVYGSGFPKSLDVSKAIDKQRDDSEDIHRVVRWVEARRVESGVTRAQVEAHFETQNIGQALFTITAGSKSRVATWEQWIELKSLLKFDNDMDAEVWRLNGRKGKPGEAFAEREVVGKRVGVDTTKQSIACAVSAQGLEQSTKHEFNITAPATDAAKEWQGWGTALKPALEPITVARKPLVGTVAENVLQHGTGAINVDGGRVGVDGGARRDLQHIGNDAETNTIYGKGLGLANPAPRVEGLGRWPANFIHDGSEEATDLLKDSARFFYCAKASKADRDAGLDGSHSKQMDESRKHGNPGGDNPRNRGVQERTNFHPTVKPTDLMRYLCRLVTPPNGILLDPFNGSGSTGCAAVLEGFQYIGIEREAEYIAISEKRIQARSKQVQEQPKQLTLL
jgi:hypothetical protein